MSGAPVAAVIFDLDGVLVDTEPVHLAATRALIAPATIDDETYEGFIGRGGFKQWLAEHSGIPVDQIGPRYDELFLVALKAANITPLEGAEAVLAAISARGLPIAVASQSSRSWVEATLDAARLRGHFRTIATAAEAGADKPAPDVYLRAAALAGVAPEACIAIEDSIPGVASAHAAGMRVVQLRQASLTPPPQPDASVVIERWSDFDERWLDGAAIGGE